MKKLSLLSVVAGAVLALAGCKKGLSLNVFPLDQDKQLGAQLKQEVMSNPSKYPVLPYQGNEKAYNYLYAMRDEILKSSKIKHRTNFKWELYIIKDDKTLNAFAAPGGFICVYTGLIKYLDHPDHLAGVLGHEIAHADNRHSTEAMTEAYGLQILLSVASGGKSSQLSEIAAGLTQLSFSRAHEKDADAHSVDYLCDTRYASNGAAGFFEKLIANKQGGGTPAFLSTHPNSGNRVKDINDRATKLNCKKTLVSDPAWAQFKAAIP